MASAQDTKIEESAIEVEPPAQQVKDGEFEFAGDSDSDTDKVVKDTKDKMHNLRMGSASVLDAILLVEDLGEKVKGDWHHPRMNIDFQIESINSEVWEKMQKDCTIRTKLKGSGQLSTEIDGSKFNLLVILNGCMDPSFRDQETKDKLKAKLGVDELTNTELIRSILLEGEIVSLAAEIMTVTGFNVEEPEEAVASLKDLS